MDSSLNASLVGTQQQHMLQWLHHNAANAATENMTQDTHLKTGRPTGSCNNKMPHSIWYQYVHIAVDWRLFTVYCTAGIYRELHD